MIAELLIAGALAPAYTGRTAENQPLRINVAGRRITRVKGLIRTYVCEEFGAVGPVEVAYRMNAPIGRDGHFSFVTGNHAERLGVAGVIRGDRMTGRIRIAGTIGTGQRCRSRIVRFRLRG